MGLVRNLTASELVEQILIAGRIARMEGRRLRNVVMMGMGEPLHNEEAVHATLSLLLSREYFAMPPRRITVSTVGVPDAMLRLVDRFPAIQLALSLHSARPEVRAKIVPWSRRYGWDELREALRECNHRQIRHREQGPVMIEYVMLAGVNDGDEDLTMLLAYLDQIPAHVNLIPYNAIPDAYLWKPTSRARIDEFAARLRASGIFTTVRFSMGTDVQAACGQLVQR
jgi:23S rRNA (adenine2503-C2)-methyltransferase